MATVVPMKGTDGVFELNKIFGVHEAERGCGDGCGGEDGPGASDQDLDGTADAGKSGGQNTCRRVADWK